MAYLFVLAILGFITALFLTRKKTPEVLMTAGQMSMFLNIFELSERNRK